MFLFDGAEKHAFLKGRHLEEVQKLAGEGVGLVFLHQLIDVPKDSGDAIRALSGGTWEKGFSQRAHWVAKFGDFPDHPASNGLSPFTIDDGYLTHLRFVSGLKGVTPQLKTVAAKPAAPIRTESDKIVAWLYERADGGRSFTFTGGHLHSSFGEEGYRRYLVNSILWTAKIEIPKDGAPVALNVSDLGSYLVAQPKK